MDRALRAAWPAAALLAVALGGATAAQAEVVRAVTLSSGSILPVVHPVSLDGAVGFQSFLLPTGGAGEATAPVDAGTELASDVPALPAEPLSEAAPADANETPMSEASDAAEDEAE